MASTAPAASSRISPAIRDLAAAMAGDCDALARVAAEPRLAANVSRQRIGALLARRANAAGITGPIVESWKISRRAVAAHWLVAEHMLGLAADALAAVSIPWAPIKGADLAFRVHETPEDRPATDLDLLVEPENLKAAVEALKRVGWSDRWGDDPGMWRYALDEGHNWPLVRPEGIMVETHFRLWGWMPTNLGVTMLRRARAAPELGATAHRLTPADALLLSACHAWTEHLGEPPLRTLYDLVRLLTTSPELQVAPAAAALVEEARTAGLLGATGSSLQLAAALWPLSPAAPIATDMLRQAPGPERLACRRLWPRIGRRRAFSALVLVRLLSRQPSRQGWRSIGRRVVPHRGLRRHRPA